MGNLCFFSKKASSRANIRLAFRVSKTVSIRNKSIPPSIRAIACSLYEKTNSSKVTFLAPGSLTSGEIDAV